jgi:hypothetical protein
MMRACESYRLPILWRWHYRTTLSGKPDFPTFFMETLQPSGFLVSDAHNQVTIETSMRRRHLKGMLPALLYGEAILPFTNTWFQVAFPFYNSRCIFSCDCTHSSEASSFLMEAAEASAAIIAEFIHFSERSRPFPDDALGNSPAVLHIMLPARRSPSLHFHVKPSSVHIC